MLLDIFFYFHYTSARYYLSSSDMPANLKNVNLELRPFLADASFAMKIGLISTSSNYGSFDFILSIWN